MFDRRNKTPIGQDKPAFVKTLTLALATIVTLGFMWTGSAKAEDMMNAWDGWPDQSRAEKLGTFTYVFGSLGLIAHDSTAAGQRAYRGIVLSGSDAVEQNAAEDSNDAFASLGFGLRLANDVNLEFGLATLNGAYDQPTASGGSNPKPDQPVFEVSAFKSFDWGGPPLLRYTARIGYAILDDPDADDNVFFGIGLGHDPFRVELRQYDFDVFESQVLAFTYVYDF